MFFLNYFFSTTQKNINDDLPNELLREVIKLSLKDRKDFLTLSLVCKIWKQFVADINPQEIRFLKPKSNQTIQGLKVIEAGRLGYYTSCPTTPHLNQSKDPEREPKQYLGLPLSFNCKLNSEEFNSYIGRLMFTWHPDRYRDNLSKLVARDACQNIQMAKNELIMSPKRFD